jgi:ribonuclease E
MKDGTAAVYVQVPVEVASFLLNEKRAEIAKIEIKQRISVLLIPNKTIETPHYKLERLKFDDPRLDRIEPSYKQVDEFEDPTAITRRSSTPKNRQTPRIKNILHDGPAPEGRAAPVFDEPAAAAPATTPGVAPPPAPAPIEQPPAMEIPGWITKLLQIWRSLFGNDVPAMPAPMPPAPAPQPTPATPAPRAFGDVPAPGPEERRGERGNRRGRGRDERRDDRRRDERRDFDAEVRLDDDAPRPERRAERSERPRGERGDRTERSERGERAERGERGERRARQDRGDLASDAFGDDERRSERPRREERESRSDRDRDTRERRERFDDAEAPLNDSPREDAPPNGERREARDGNRERRSRDRYGRERREREPRESRDDARSDDDARRDADASDDTAAPQLHAQSAPRSYFLRAQGESGQAAPQAGTPDATGTPQAADAPAAPPRQAKDVRAEAKPRAAAVQAPETAVAEPATGTRRMPAIGHYTLPVEELMAVASAAELEWVNSNPERVAAVQAAIAAEPKPVHVPRERPPLKPMDELPPVLVETKRQLVNPLAPEATADVQP